MEIWKHLASSWVRQEKARYSTMNAVSFFAFDNQFVLLIYCSLLHNLFMIGQVYYFLVFDFRCPQVRPFLLRPSNLLDHLCRLLIAECVFLEHWDAFTGFWFCKSRIGDSLSNTIHMCSNYRPMGCSTSKALWYCYSHITKRRLGPDWRASGCVSMVDK